MRHIYSLAAGLIIAPVAWTLLGLAGARPEPSWTAPGWPGTVLSVLLPIAAGALLGLIATTAISPVGPAVAGVIFFTGHLLYVVMPYQTLTMAWSLLPVPAALGMGLVLGTMLLTALISVGRWRPRALEPPALAAGRKAAPAEEPIAMSRRGPRSAGLRPLRATLSLAAGLLVALAAWAILQHGLAQPHTHLDTNPRAGGVQLSELFFGYALLAAGGLVIGLVATTRISPAGPAAAGLLFLLGQSVFVWYPDLAGSFPGWASLLFDDPAVTAAPATHNLTLVAGAALLTALFSDSRWGHTDVEPQIHHAPDPPAPQPVTGFLKPYGSGTVPN
ncbi:MAG: hypothetical protein ACRDTQ_05415 [Micromonosporaceae bacterium]